MRLSRIYFTAVFAACFSLYVVPISPRLPLSTSAFRLPIGSGLKVTVSQGNNDVQHDHVGKAAWAFDFTVGQTNFVVAAAQGGTVIGADDSSTTGCDDISCWTDANYVLIADDDGATAALYLHLLPHSLKVTTGMHVDQGEPLGLADTTGWATGPHLHFQVEAIPSVPAQPQKSPGWWWTTSRPVQFSNTEVLAQDSNGVPKFGQSFTVSALPQLVASPTPPIPMPPPAPTQPPTQQPNFSPFVGTWYAHAQQLVINANGKAVYTGRVFVWCVDDQGNTVAQPPCDGGGSQGINPNQHALVTFTSVIGNTASGTITPGGTAMRYQNASGSIIPIGSTVTVKLHPGNDTLSVSNGILLCGPQAIQNNVDPGCNSGA